MGVITGATLVGDLSRRLRDTGNTAYSGALVLNILDRVQDSVNMRLGLVHGSVTLATTATVFYDAATMAADFAYVVQAYDQNQRELDVVAFTDLVHNDPHWIRIFAHRPELVSQVGRDLVIVTPITHVTENLTIRYVKHPAALVNDTTAWDLPDEHSTLVLDLAEAVLLFRGRYFKAMQECLQRAAPKLGLEDAMQLFRKVG